VDNPIPELYVLWHPECMLGEKLARKIHAWLRPGYGLGPRVFYRCLPAPEAPAGGLPPPLPGETRQPGSEARGADPVVANLQIALPLIDEHMIVDPAWRWWLSQLALQTETSQPRVLLPVALDSTAFNVPPRLRDRNFLRPTGLPLPPPEALDRSTAIDIVVRSLLKQLTETLCQRLISSRTSLPAAAPPGSAAVAPGDPGALLQGSGSKIMIFLSHAKGDGTTPAKRIRDYIYSNTQLAVFYDENDIPFGSVYPNVLQASVQGEKTAAMIVIRSARYASRPWCRRELSWFRRPVDEDPVPGKPQIWRLNPTIIVDALDGNNATLGIPEVGNAPIMRWSDDVKNPEEQVVTTVMRDALLAVFHTAVGRTIDTQKPDSSVVLNWLPDPTTLLHILRKRKEKGLRTEDLLVLYPGRGLSRPELDILEEFFPDFEFRTFEAAAA
jgi:hypothetical protein